MRLAAANIGSGIRLPLHSPVPPVELSANPRVELLLDMVREISEATTPGQILRAFASRYWTLRPVDYFISLSTRDLPAGRYRITRQFDVAAATDPSGALRLPVDDPPGPPPPVLEGGFLAEIVREGRPRLLHDLQLRGDPVLGDALAEMGSAMAIPLFDQSEVKNWSLHFRRAPDGYTEDDLEQALVVANLVGGTNRRLVLAQEVRKLNAAMAAQFEEVARVQRALLPRQIPEIPGLEIATSYLTSQQAGGDYYDFFPFEDGRWGILIADVAGHGAGAATVMAMLHAILHAYTGPQSTPDAVLAYANARLVHSRIEGSFTTAFLAVYDPRDGTLTYARSGHNPPRLKSDGGAVRSLDGAGVPPLGVLDEFPRERERLRLTPGDTLVLYTDGITEARDPDGRMFGAAGLDAALEGCTGAPDCVVDSVHAALFRHTGSLARHDDQTLVAIRYRGAEGGGA